MMADQLFNDSSTVGSTADIPDIFDVLEGGEDEGAVRYLLGFNGDEGGLLGQVETFGGMEVMDKYVGEGMNLGLSGAYIHTQAPSTTVLQTKTPITIRHLHAAANNKKRDTSGAKAIHNCNSCGKCFTTKFNLKRHINMHCHKSKENGVPIQGPPSASAPAKKTDKTLMKTELRMTGLHANENQQQKVHISNTGTVLTPNHTIIHSAHTPVTYSRVVTVPQTEYQRTEPDSTYKLPSVQTILPVSTVYTTINSAVAGANSFSTIAASCDSSQTVSSVTSSSHNTDFGPLPADLFDPDSSRSQPPSPTSPNGSQHEAEENYSNPVTLTSIPAGWTRKVSFETRRVSYFSPLGKVFNSHEDITQYFKTFNFLVPLGLFNFDPSFMNDSEEEEEDSEDEEEEDDEYDELDDDDEEEYNILCAKRRRSDIQYTSYGSPTLGATPSPGATPSSSPPT